MALEIGGADLIFAPAPRVFEDVDPVGFDVLIALDRIRHDERLDLGFCNRWGVSHPIGVF